MITGSIRRLAALTVFAISATCALADAPSYTIIDLGRLGTKSVAVQSISPDGHFIAGFSSSATQPLHSGVIWTQESGMLALGDLPPRTNLYAYGVNNAGTVAGVASFGGGTIPFGQPVVWNNGVASPLALPAGHYAGSARGINGSGVVVGAASPTIGGAAAGRGVVWVNGVGTPITVASDSGHYMSEANAVNDAGLVAGWGQTLEGGLGPGVIYDMAAGTMRNVGMLPGHNLSTALDISNSGYAVGYSAFYSNDHPILVPFIWSAAAGITAIPQPSPEFNNGRAVAVNDNGWAVGFASRHAVIGESMPFLYAGGTSYPLENLLAPGSGWQLGLYPSTADALDISDDGVIVGTGVLNGAVHAYMMVPVPEPGGWALLLAGLAFAGVRRVRASRSSNR